MHSNYYEKLKHPEAFSLTALVTLSKLRRKVTEHGYDFFNLKEGEAILLLEAARVIDCDESKELAHRFLSLIGVTTDEFKPKQEIRSKSRVQEFS